MNKSLFSVVVVGLWLGGAAGFAEGLPKSAVQALIKGLQDASPDVRLASAQALGKFEESTAIKALESALMAANEAGEQDALGQALKLNKDPGSAKRLTDAFNNPQFTWGKGAKVKAIDVIAAIGGKKTIKWLTDLAASDQAPELRAAAARALGDIGAPPKKEN